MKKKMRILLALGLVLVCLLSVAAYGANTSSGKIYKITLGTTWPMDHQVTKAFNDVFIPYVTKHTNGHVIITQVANNQLGTEEDLTNSVINGQIEMAGLGNLIGATMVLELGTQELPFLWEKEDDFWKLTKKDGTWWKAAQKALDRDGVTMITVHKRGFRQTTSNSPINKLSDFKGLKMRMSSTPIILNTFKSFGINPTIIAWSELYTALQQHVVEASEGSIDSIYAQKLYEVQNHLAITNHILSTGFVLVNTKYFNTLPKNYQKVIMDAGVLFKDRVYQSISGSEQSMIKDMQAHGVTVTYPDRSEMKKACKDVLKKFVDDNPCMRPFLEMFGKKDYPDKLI